MTYQEEVQGAIDRIVGMAEQAELNHGRWPLSSWYGSVCKWIREREQEMKGFIVTLPNPKTGGEPLTIIEVEAPQQGGSSGTHSEDHVPAFGG